MKASIRRILLPVDPSVFTDGATETACLIAKTHDAQISAVAVLDSPEIRASLVPAIGPYYPMMVDEVQKMINHADHVLKECLERCATACEKAGVAHRETEYEGIPAEMLIGSAIFYDLIVTGLETSFHFETRGSSGQSLYDLLDHTAPPVLAVPATGMKKLEKVVVAFDGSIGAARALHDLIPLALPFDPEFILFVAEKTQPQTDFLLGNAELLLRAHGFSKITRWSSDSHVEIAYDELLAAEKGIDLVTLGIQARNRVKDLFVGNFTKSLITRGDIPLFLSH